MTKIFKTITLSAFLLLTSLMFAQKTKPVKNAYLEGKKFNVNFYELKASGKSKAMPTMVLIKGGKVEADLMYEKLQMQPITYTVTTDSTYTEDDSENRIVTFEAVDSAEKNEYKWEVTVTNYDIEGTVTVSKGGVEKKKYEFSGTEKAKKK